MKLKFLGTAAAEGWPAVFCQCPACLKARQSGGKNIRTRSSCLIDEKYLIDLPPDTYLHVLNNDLDLGNIQHLIVTHSHQDHFYPEELIMRLPPFAHLNVKQPLNIYGNNKVKEAFERVKGSRDITDILEFHEVFEFQSFKAGDAVVTPLLAMHDRKEKCYIYALESNGQKLLYGHDTGYFPEQTWQALVGHRFDAIILDCTSGPKEEGGYHMGFSFNLKVKDRLMEQNNADHKTKFIITHFSHNGGMLHEELIQMAAPYGFEVAYDGFEIIV